MIPKATLPLTFKWLQHADDWLGFGPDEAALLFGLLRFRNAAVQAGDDMAKTVHFEHQLDVLAKNLPGGQLCTADHWATHYAGSMVIPSLARVTEPTQSAAAVLTAPNRWPPARRERGAPREEACECSGEPPPLNATGELADEAFARECQLALVKGGLTHPCRK